MDKPISLYINHLSFLSTVQMLASPQAAGTAAAQFRMAEYHLKSSQMVVQQTTEALSTFCSQNPHTITGVPLQLHSPPENFLPGLLYHCCSHSLRTLRYNHQKHVYGRCHF